MTSIFKNISEQDFKVEKESLKNFEPTLQHPQTNPWLLTVAVGAAFIISLISLVGSVSLYQSLNKERRERQALEAGQVKMQEKAKLFEQAARTNSKEVAKLLRQAGDY